MSDAQAVGARLGAHSYGKTGVRLAKVEREGATHTFHDLTLRLWLEGDFSAAFLRGDNSTSLPTDTMRATAYHWAKDHPLGEVEVYAEAVLRRLLDVVPVATVAHAEVEVHGWERLVVDGQPHPHSFRATSGVGTATVALPRDAAALVTSGLMDLLITKTTASAYSGFLTDELTVLAETDDRILSTSVQVSWEWETPPPSYAAARAAARAALERAFATTHSDAVQQTLVLMGEAVLAAVPGVRSVSLRLPNRHHVAVDLSKAGQRNDNEVFVVLDRPHGDISATVHRS